MGGGWGYENALTETVFASETAQACEPDAGVRGLVFGGSGAEAVWDCRALCVLPLFAVTDHFRVSVYGS